MEPYRFSRSYVKVHGHRVKYLGEGIRHALRCPCFIFFEARTYNCIDICRCLLCVFGAVVNFHRLDP
jgi:hypothetical protein